MHRNKKLWLNLLIAISFFMIAVVIGYCGVTTGLNVNSGLSAADNTLTASSDPWIVTSESTGWPQSVVPGSLIEGSGNEVALRTTVYPEDSKATSILFKNNRQSVSVYADGQPIYSLGLDSGNFKFSTNGYCAVSLPEMGKAYSLELRFTHLTDGKCLTPQVFFGSSGAVVYHLIMQDAFSLFFLPFAAVAFVILLIMTLYARTRGITSLRPFTLLVYIGYALLYLICQLNLMAIFPVNREILTVLSYFALMLIPIAALYFIQNCCPDIPLKFYQPLLAILHINIVVQSTLVLFGVCGMSDMSGITSLLLVATGVYAALATLKEYRKKPSSHNLFIHVCNGLTIAIAIITLILFLLTGRDSAIIKDGLQIAFMVVIVMMVGDIAFYVSENIEQRTRQDAEITALEEALMVDMLTGVGNRRAYDQMMEDIASKSEHYPDPLLILIDVNGLRYINDTCGKAKGGEVLVVVAKSILAGCGDNAMIFRLNGDDFAVVVPDASTDDGLCVDLMNKHLEEFNNSNPIPVEVSIGKAFLNKGSEKLTVDEWRALAEKRLYDSKLSSRVRGGSLSDEYMQLIESFVSAVDAKDTYTAYHSRRVGDVSKAICGWLGLSESTSNTIEMAARLHDIGKIGIPDKVLTKAGRLTDEEWMVMKSHPVLGESIVKRIKPIYEVGDIIRHHHERYDGCGYPDGVQGINIPLGSRIIAIADSIDAMTTSRVYRGRMSLAQCREQIEQNMGVMYDPTIAAIVLENWDKVGEILSISYGEPNSLSRALSVDMLTELASRGAFDEKISTYRREMPDSLSLALIQINDLEGINNKLGNRVGDEIIAISAHCTKMAFSEESDMLFRIDGDTFAVISDANDDDGMRRKVALLQQYVADEVRVYDVIDGCDMPVSLSVGLAFHDVEKDHDALFTPDDLIANANESLLSEKRKHYEDARFDRRNR